MDRNKFRYCTLLLTDNDNHSKIFISEKNRYYIRRDNKSIHLQILNEFKYIRKSYNKIDVIGKNNNYYKINELRIIRHCAILLIDGYNHSKIFISEKNLYYISYAGDKYYDDDYDYFDDYYFVDDYDYYDDSDDDCLNDFIVNYYDGLVYYKKPLNDFKPLVSVKNNIINLIDEDNYRNKITLLVDGFNILTSGNNN